MTSNELQTNEAWTSYWQTGTGASCFAGRDLELRLNQVWQAHVSLLADGASILDLATGNGTVARSYAAAARSLGIRLLITAVDAAQIDPPRVVGDPQQLFRDIRFCSNIRLESLPFQDGEFDGVVSQFGFEYAEEEPAAAEAARVLAPGGQLRLVIHARDGEVARDIRMRLERLQSVLGANGPVGLVLDLARAAEAGDTTKLSKRSEQLAAAVDLAKQLGRNPPADDSALFYASECLSLWAQRNNYWPADLRRSVEQGWHTARGVVLRQEQMLRVAGSAEDVARLGRRFERAGLTLDAITPIHDESRDVQIAWLLQARRIR
jgi:SAM-dependent methyltransferase